MIVDHVKPELFREKYSDVYNGNDVWNNLQVTSEKRFDWPESTYVKKPTFFSFKNVSSLWLTWMT